MERPKVHLMNRGASVIFMVAPEEDFGKPLSRSGWAPLGFWRPRMPTAAFIAKDLQIEVFMIGGMLRRGRWRCISVHKLAIPVCQNLPRLWPLFQSLFFAALHA
jgi:hypothetical protein